MMPNCPICAAAPESGSPTEDGRYELVCKKCGWAWRLEADLLTAEDLQKISGTVCPECKGKKRVRCYRCKGKRAGYCDDCGGTGKIDCPVCIA